MTLPYTLYPGKAGSPITTLTAQYVAGTDSSVQVEDASVLPSASNRVTIMKTDRSAFVTVKYTTVSGNTLSGLTYEEGDLTTFPEGSIAVRNIANKDFSDVIGDINYLESAKVNVSQGAAESGKYLKVGVDGNVTTGTAVSDYPDLTNKPSINSVTILGNKTSEQLNIVTNLTKAQYDALSAEEKMSGKIFFTTDEAGGGGGGGGGVSDYNDLSNRPQINSITLTGNLSSASLGLQNTITASSKLSSDLVDDTGAVNKFVTAQNKLDWSAKQNEITSASKLSADLVTDTDATNKFYHTHALTHAKNGTDEIGIDGTQVTSGIIDIARIPAGAKERMITVADDAARFALTTAEVQNGDSVYVTATGRLYIVVDDTKLNQEAGYMQYRAYVSWDSIDNKPSTYAPSVHSASHGAGQSDAITIAESQVTDLVTDLAGKASSVHTHTKSQITDFPTTETWTFTLTGGVVVTKNVYVGGS